MRMQAAGEFTPEFIDWLNAALAASTPFGDEHQAIVECFGCGAPDVVVHIPRTENLWWACPVVGGCPGSLSVMVTVESTGGATRVAGRASKDRT